jgi:hypothetical protein
MAASEIRLCASMLKHAGWQHPKIRLSPAHQCSSTHMADGTHGAHQCSSTPDGSTQIRLCASMLKHTADGTHGGRQHSAHQHTADGTHGGRQHSAHHRTQSNGRIKAKAHGGWHTRRTAAQCASTLKHSTRRMAHTADGCTVRINAQAHGGRQHTANGSTRRMAHRGGWLHTADGCTRRMAALGGWQYASMLKQSEVAALGGRLSADGPALGSRRTGLGAGAVNSGWRGRVPGGRRGVWRSSRRAG